MLLYSEDKFSDFKAIVGSKYSDLTMQERFEDARERIHIGQTTNSSGIYEHGGGSSPRWFYVVFARFDPSCNEACETSFACNDEYLRRCYGPVRVKYNLHFKNGGKLGEVPWDEAGLVVVTAIVLGLFATLAAFSAWLLGALKAQDRLHQTPQLLACAVALDAVGATLDAGHAAALARDGRGASVRLVRAADFMSLIADGLVLFVLLLCARGWNIIRRKLPAADRLRIAVFATTYACVIVVTFVWRVITEDRAMVAAPYDDGGPGFLLLAFRIFGGAWVLKACVATRAHFHSKRRFFKMLGFAAAQWTISAPFIFFVAALVKDTERRKVAATLEPMLALVTQIILVALFRPTPDNTVFPFDATVARAGSNPLVLRWSSKVRQCRVGDQDEAAPRHAQSVSGGRDSDVNARGQYVIRDKFEALHVFRLRRIQTALDSRIGSLHHFASSLQEALQQCRLTEPPRSNWIPTTPKAPVPVARRVHHHAPPVASAADWLSSPDVSPSGASSQDCTTPSTAESKDDDDDDEDEGRKDAAFEALTPKEEEEEEEEGGGGGGAKSPWSDTSLPQHDDRVHFVALQSEHKLHAPDDDGIRESAYLPPDTVH
ncbi:hypothetical protein CTAYLR_000438 [Chrysophaeum taylorii]|uniref:GPR180/TMEM145 transmembrane domain-containing protein n=1 Tax=Chrysophaeum taylorii TaxID=2483200 RepID=A0AAD7UG46_9STRA|nr:hypothetical protein CTAYLR_000438 [Chrysophaeum taylorii]